MQSGIWRDTYGNPKAHDTSVRGIAVDPLNQIVLTGSSDRNVKFWKFKNDQSYKPLTVITMDEPISFFVLIMKVQC